MRSPRRTDGSDPLQMVLDGLAKTQPPRPAIRRAPPRNPGWITVEVVAYDEIAADLVVTSDRWPGTRRVDPFITRAFDCDMPATERARRMVGRRFCMERTVRYAAGAYLPKHFLPSGK